MGEKDILDRDRMHLRFLNHSSLVSGDAVSSAGDMRVEDGRLSLISDKSGHYKPDNQMFYNAVRSFVDQGVAPEGLTTELGQKVGTQMGLRNGDLQASALELMSYGGSTEAESRMRDARSQRYEAMDTIRLKLWDGLTKTETNDRSAPRGGRVVDASKGVVPERQRSVEALRKRFEPGR